jgi:hypothetical protein
MSKYSGAVKMRDVLSPDANLPDFTRPGDRVPGTLSAHIPLRSLAKKYRDF